MPVCAPFKECVHGFVGKGVDEGPDGILCGKAHGEVMERIEGHL